MFAELSRSKPCEFISKRVLMAAAISALMISQQYLKRTPVKLSGPGALSPGMEKIVSLISSWVKGTSS